MGLWPACVSLSWNSQSGQWPAQLTQSLDSVQRSLLAGLWGPWEGRAVPSRLGRELWGLLVSRVSVHTERIGFYLTELGGPGQIHPKCSPVLTLGHSELPHKVKWLEPLQEPWPHRGPRHDGELGGQIVHTADLWPLTGPLAPVLSVHTAGSLHYKSSALLHSPCCLSTLQPLRGLRE